MYSHQSIKLHSVRRRLLPEPQRKDSGYRVYSESDLKRLLFIRQAKSLGFSLDEIRDILRMREHGHCPCCEVVSIAERHLRAVEQQLQQLSKFSWRSQQSREAVEEIQRANAVGWRYSCADMTVDPSSQSGQSWDVFMAQAVFPTESTGAVNGAAPKVTQVKVTPHPMHYNDICRAGSGCIQQQGNRNLADFFVVTIDHTGAAEVVYDDTSNGLVQPGFTPTGNQTVDHAGAGVITVARQSSGPGLFGTNVSGPSNAPTTGITDNFGDALYPVIGGTNVPGRDILSNSISLSGNTLNVTTRIVDLSHPATTAASIPGTAFLQ
jgi:DNA-binding transcriptional MerR regulator